MTTALVPRYTWRENVPVHADAQPIGEALMDLAQTNGVDGMTGLTPEDVVDAARDPRSPLHTLFEWDNEHAANLWRRTKARLIIASIRVQYEAEETHQIAFVNVRVSGERYYVPTSIAARNADLRSQMLQDARSGLQGWQRRYRDLAGQGRAMDLVQEAITEIEQQLEGDAPLLPAA